jgi:hypothetical protein
VDSSTAINRLLRHRRASAIERVVLDTSEPLRILGVRCARIGAADKVVFGAVDVEVLIAETRALGGDGDIAGAGAQALGPGDVVVSAAISDLVANGNGAMDHGKDCCCEEQKRLGGGAGELHFG